jgi:periplasmic protein TonB
MFEDVLSRREPARGTGRALSLPAAIALHALALATVVGASIWFSEDLPEPAVPVAFFVPQSPPAPPGRPATRSAAAPPKARGVSAPAPVVIRETPPGETREPSPPVAEEEANPGAVGIGEDDGAGIPGLSDGVPGATGPGGSFEPGGEPPRPGGDIRAPELVRRIEPGYPEPARKARQEGIVVLEAIIAASGSIEDVRVVKSAGVLLDSAAEEAVRRWRYRPATLNGRAVRVLLTVTVAFRLH